MRTPISQKIPIYRHHYKAQPKTSFETRAYQSASRVNQPRRTSAASKIYTHSQSFSRAPNILYIIHPLPITRLLRAYLYLCIYNFAAIGNARGALLFIVNKPSICTCFFLSACLPNGRHPAARYYAANRYITYNEWEENGRGRDRERERETCCRYVVLTCV